MKNEDFPQEHRDKLYPHVSEAVAKNCENYNMICVGRIPEDVNVHDAARQLYPAGYSSLMRIEKALDSYDHTEEEYKTLCANYISGWTKLFEKITKYYQQKRS